MAIDWWDHRKLGRDIEKCTSLVRMFSEITDVRSKEMPKAQLYHLVTALIELQLWGKETTFSRIYNIHGAIPMVNFIEDFKPKKITLLEAIRRFSNPEVIKITKKGNSTFFKVGKLEEYNRKEWTSEEEQIILEIISLRELFGSQTYAILGLSNPSSLEGSISWLEKQAIDNLKKCAGAVAESKSRSEINRQLRDCAKFVKSALDKVMAYREICPQIKEHFENRGITLPIDLSFHNLKSLETEFYLKREEISELRHIAFSKFGIGRSDRDRSHIPDIVGFDETDIASFFEYVELTLSREGVCTLEEYLTIQANEALSEFDKNIFKLLLEMARNVRYYDE